MADIQLLLRDDVNRRALASLVAERHTPITKTDLQPADLYLVDDISLPKYQETLQARKHEQDPIFCPVVLLRRDRTPLTINLQTPEVSDRPLLVNEIVQTPVDKQAFFRRIANLLSGRRRTMELQEKNERLERFARSLRHELRNPLQILDGYLDIAREQDGRNAIEKCQTATDRMKRLLEDTLLIIQSNTIDIDRRQVDLASVCTTCWNVVAESEIQIDIATSQLVSANEDRLKQLLENLFRNAVEHGGDDVTVTVGDLEDGFFVEDDGPGIPPDKRDAVFEEGYSTCESGTGLGLAVVQAVSDLHGWEVQITDGTEGGARFEITGVAVTEEVDDVSPATSR